MELDAVKPVIDHDLCEQLKAMNQLDPSLEILKAQNDLKAKAREEKALKQLAKGFFGCSRMAVDARSTCSLSKI